MLRLLTLLSVLLIPVLGHAAGAEIHLEQNASKPGEIFHLRIQDHWPNACVPEIETVEIEGPQVWVIARDTSEGKICGQSGRGYGIDTRWLGNGGTRLAESGVQRIHYVVRSRTGVRQRGFELIAMGEAMAPAAALESGYWWADPAVPNAFAGRGIGINLERQGDIQSGVLFGFDGNGDPDWSLGSGSVGPHFTRMGFSRLSQGAGPYALYREPRELQTLGAMLIEPASPTRARLWLVYVETTTNDLSLREIEIVRFGFAASPASAWAGEWLLAPSADESGWAHARQFSLVAVQGGPSEFTLLDANGTIALSCTMVGGSTDRIPDLCNLTMPDEAGNAEYSFDRIGLRRMQGTDSEGRGVRLILLGTD